MVRNVHRICEFQYAILVAGNVQRELHSETRITIGLHAHTAAHTTAAHAAAHAAAAHTTAHTAHMPPPG
jgi:hypothetical protein